MIVWLFIKFLNFIRIRDNDDSKVNVYTIKLVEKTNTSLLIGEHFL